MDINDEEWQRLLDSLVPPVDIDFNAAEWNLDGPMAQSDRPTQPSQITNPTNHTDTPEPTTPTKACQDLTPPVFAPDSVPVANMLPDPGLHEQQAPPGEASESSDVSRLMSRVQNLEAK